MSIASLGVDFAMLSIGFGIAWVHPVTSTQSELVKIAIVEERPDLGELEALSRDVLTTISPTPQQVFLPWSTHDHSMSVWIWEGAWRTDDDLFVQCFPYESPVKITLGSNDALVSPILNTNSGSLDIAVIDNDGNKVKLLRLEQGSEKVAPKISWPQEWSINGKPIAAKLILDSKIGGSTNKIAMISDPGKDEINIQLMDMKSTDNTQTATVPGISALPNSNPSGYVDDKGNTHLSFIAADAKDDNNLILIDAVFGPDDKTCPKVETSKIASVKETPKATTTSYQVLKDRPMRRDWAVALDEGTVINNYSPDKPFKTNAPLVLPLTLLTSSQATYVLTADDKGPTLEAVH